MAFKLQPAEPHGSQRQAARRRHQQASRARQHPDVGAAPERPASRPTGSRCACGWMPSRFWSAPCRSLREPLRPRSGDAAGDWWTMRRARETDDSEGLKPKQLELEARPPSGITLHTRAGERGAGRHVDPGRSKSQSCTRGLVTATNRQLGVVQTAPQGDSWKANPVGEIRASIQKAGPTRS